MLGPDAGKNVRANHRLADPLGQTGGNFAGQFQAAFAAADFDVLADLRRGRFVDDRPHVRARIGRVADHERPRRFDEPPEEQIVDAVQGDHPAARGAFLAAVAEGRLPDAQHGLVEIGRVVDDDRVLAAHLAHDFLDECLVGLRVAGACSGSAGQLPSSR